MYFLFNVKGLLSFWNDNISYVLRGTILIELSLRDRIECIKDPRKPAFADREVKVKVDFL